MTSFKGYYPVFGLLALLSADMVFAQSLYNPKSMCRQGFGPKRRNCDLHASIFLVDKPTPSEDPFLSNLTATNELTYRAKCDISSADVDAKFVTDTSTYQVAVGPQVGTSTITYNFPVPENSRTPAKAYHWEIRFGARVSINTFNCDMKILSNVTKVNLEPLEAVSGYLVESILQDYQTKDNLLLLQVLPAAWGSLEQRIDEIDNRIELEQINLEIAQDSGDEIQIFDIQERIDFYQSLKANLEEALEIADDCSENNDTLCLNKAKELDDLIDRNIAEKKQTLETYLNYVNREYARAEKLAEQYKERILAIISKLNVGKQAESQMAGAGGEIDQDQMIDALNLMDMPSMNDLKEFGVDGINKRYTLTPELKKTIKEKGVPLTTTCQWAALPYAYQLKDAVAFINQDETYTNIFSYDRMDRADCATVDLSDQNTVMERKTGTHVGSLAEMGISANTRKELTGEDDPFWDFVRQNSERIVQTCSWAVRPRIYRFNDYVAYLSHDRTNFNIFSIETVKEKGCKLP